MLKVGVFFCLPGSLSYSTCALVFLHQASCLASELSISFKSFTNMKPCRLKSDLVCRFWCPISGATGTFLSWRLLGSRGFECFNSFVVPEMNLLEKSFSFPRGTAVITHHHTGGCWFVPRRAARWTTKIDT